mmetsp:Transcript_878/g.2015  ORF Transcript_878/g.2015 Transcript_878/m.2015 type:complete len:634 (+) Transcript_878:965-2866(+)
MQLQLGLPFGGVDAGDGVELLGAERQPLPVQVAVVGRHAEDVLVTTAGAFEAVQHPLEHAHVLAVAGPDEFAVRALAEPVDAVDGRQLGPCPFRSCLQLGAQVQPVLEIVGHVVAHEGQHRERVAAHHALLAGGRGRGLAAHGGGHVDAFHPVAGLGHQRHGGGAAAAEDEGVDLHAGRVVPGGVQRRVVGGGHREAGVRVGGLGAGGLGDLGCPVLALPVDQVGRKGLVRRVGLHAFPPHVAVVGQRHVREDHVAVQAGHAVRVGLVVGARRDTEIAGLGVDGSQRAVGLRLDPGDVVADGRDLPALEARRRHQHREIGLATGAGEGGRDVVLLAGRALDAQDQHVLGQPALVAAHGGRDAQREALLAQQRIAAVARAIAPDLARLGVMDDVFGRVAGPAHVGLTRLQRRAHGVHAGHEVAVGAQQLDDGTAHARHRAHVDGHIRAVAELHADVGDRRAQRAHAERHHIQRAAAHAALEQRLVTGLQQLAHFRRGRPVVRGAGVFLALRADEGAVLDPGDVARVRVGEVAAGAQRRVEFLEGTGRDQLVAEALVLVGAAVTPVDVGGLGEGGNLGHPGNQPGVFDIGRQVQMQAQHRGLVHGEFSDHGDVFGAACRAGPSTPGQGGRLSNPM